MQLLHWLIVLRPDKIYYSYRKYYRSDLEMTQALL